jgi:hypothetical protein
MTTLPPLHIAGEIIPQPGADKPLFTVFRRDYPAGLLQDAEAQLIRPCEHGAFKLDDRWHTVRCGRCKEPVDAYAALRSIAEQWEQMERRHARMEEAERRLLLEALRRFHRLRGTSEANRAAIAAALANYRATLDDLRTLARRVERGGD